MHTNILNPNRSQYQVSPPPARKIHLFGGVFIPLPKFNHLGNSTESPENVHSSGFHNDKRFIEFLDPYCIRNHYQLLTNEIELGETLIQLCKTDLMTALQSIIVSLGMCLAGLIGFLFERTSYEVAQKLLELRKGLLIREMSNVTNIFLTKINLYCMGLKLGASTERKDKLLSTWKADRSGADPERVGDSNP